MMAGGGRETGVVEGCETTLHMLRGSQRFRIKPSLSSQGIQRPETRLGVGKGGRIPPNPEFKSRIRTPNSPALIAAQSGRLRVTSRALWRTLLGVPRSCCSCGWQRVRAGKASGGVARRRTEDSGEASWSPGAFSFSTMNEAGERRGEGGAPKRAPFLKSGLELDPFWRAWGRRESLAPGTGEKREGS